MATKRQGKPSKVVAMSLALLLSSQAVVPYAYASEQEQGSDQIEPAALSAASEKTASENSAVDETTYAVDIESANTESANAESSNIESTNAKPTNMESAGVESADKLASGADAVPSASAAPKAFSTFSAHLRHPRRQIPLLRQNLALTQTTMSSLRS